MKKIEEFVNSIYRNVDGNKDEINELKQEMRMHLLESVHDLKQEGKSEEQAIRIAIENFGEKKQITKGLYEFFNAQKRFTRYVLAVSFISLLLSIFFFTTTYKVNKDAKEEALLIEQEKEIIMNDVFSILENYYEVPNEKEKGLLEVFEKYEEKLNFLAAFSASDLEDWLSENEYVKEGPKAHFPINYSEATFIIGDEGVIENKEQVVPSNYDLGTIVMANAQWIVQFEYKSSYENTVETNHQLLHYELKKSYQVPIIFFVIFGVLAIVWLSLKIHNRQLKDVMS